MFAQACATPSEKFLKTAEQFNFSSELVAGTPFEHRLFVNALATSSNTLTELHIYFDGDGSPWRNETRIAEDPTARNPLILQLMAKDPYASILVGRPCYYGLNTAASCSEALWTSDRYASIVIDSMEAVISNWLSTKHVDKLVLIGYSGGGVLAAFLASRLKQTNTLLTIASNLDVEAWSKHHGYPAPSGSLNPAVDAHIPESVHQIHIAGLKDSNVPAKIIETFSRSQKNSFYLGISEYDHVCCWADNWPEILKFRLENQSKN